MTDLAGIRTFPQLITYLREELDWPIASENFEELTFEYTPEELGIDSESAAKIQEIKRLRPLSPHQPWGIFFVKFEPKKLPVVALRRILSRVALKKRASANSSDRAAWAADDLLFVSNFGDGDRRQISFAHFSQDPSKHDLPVLKVLGWDNLDTVLHLDGVATELATKLSWPKDESDIDRWREQWRSAFTLRPDEVIKTSKALATSLAGLARDIRDRIKTVVAIETENGPVTKLMRAFQEALVHDLDADGFADMYAQTIAYGLLSARITNPKADTADGLATQLPVTNPFLKELMETFLHVGGRKVDAGPGPGIDFDELGVSEVVELLDHANMDAVVRDFGDKNPEDDPVIHFYELFLKQYDAKQKVNRGVFYTPRPVVSYIVRSVDELLRTEFGLTDGLADTITWGEMSERHTGLTLPEEIKPTDRFITILDPATGTGTFLVEAIEVIHRTLLQKWTREGISERGILDLWNEYVPDHLLPRLHGYELLMAPYAIAHLKVGLKLLETGYRFESRERARIYLTNALEPASELSEAAAANLFEALGHEAQAVNAVKQRERFTVVVGNPPYSVVSSNTGQWIKELCEPFKVTVRQHERQIQALSDDYVKFVRLAQWQLERSSAGVIGVITNNGYLDGHLFVDVRSSLLNTCPQVFVLNLHGNLRTQERTPDGERDDNVFDIQTGVAISLLIQVPSGSTTAVNYADVWGNRLAKYARLAAASLQTTPWSALAVTTGTDVWLPVSEDARNDWDQMRPLLDVFGSGDRRADAQRRYAAGFVSQQDDFAIAFSADEIQANLAMLLRPGMTESELRQQFRLCTTSQWSFQRARMELSAVQDVESLLTQCVYRPFDARWTVFHRGVVSILRKELMRHLLGHQNVALLVTRGISRQEFAHVFVVDKLVDRHALDSASESMFVFPLYVYPDAPDASRLGSVFSEKEQAVNFAPDFLTETARALGHAVASDPVEVFRYIYAVFHSPEYRHRYAAFLKIDFPRVPIPQATEVFGELVALGGELVDLHLGAAPAQVGITARYTNVTQAWLYEVANGQTPPVTLSFSGPAEPVVGKVGWSDDTVWIDAIKPRKETLDARSTGTVGFHGVPEEIWNFHIGGYQVCEKWLKDRKGRTLTADDLGHYYRTVISLHETSRIMREIDEVIEANGGWPSAFVSIDREVTR